MGMHFTTSVGRCEISENSNIDLLINIKPEKVILPLEQQMICVASMKSELIALLGREVDVQVRAWLKTDQKKQIAKTRTIRL